MDARGLIRMTLRSGNLIPIAWACFSYRRSVRRELSAVHSKRVLIPLRTPRPRPGPTLRVINSRFPSVMTPIVIAIDGPSGAGKGTVPGRAASLGYRHVDTGAMYRAVGLAARLHDAMPLDDEPRPHALADGADIVVESGRLGRSTATT